MKPTKYPLVIWQGKTFTFHFELLDKEENPLNLTGYTARMQLRVDYDSEDPVFELTTENGRVTIDELAGAVDLFISAADTEDLAAGSYKYDLELVGSVDIVVCPIYGKVKVLREVTK